MAVKEDVKPGATQNPLWEFSNWAYEDEGVKKACLALQNRLGCDVNMIMFLLWLADSGIGQSRLAQYLGAALKISREWQKTLVEPLRAVRNNLKDFSESGQLGADKAAVTAIRERVKACELDMERLQTAAMYGLVTDTRTEYKRADKKLARNNATNNLTVYFSATGVNLDALGKSHVALILDGVFG